MSRERREVGILDTNVVINLTRLPTGDLPLTSLITTVTLAELSVGPLVAESAERQAHLQMAEADFEPLIAAIALANDLPVYTSNHGDLSGIDGLQLVAVPSTR